VNLPFLHPQPGGCSLALKVLPRAPRTEVGETLGGELKLSVAAPPVDDAANEELIRFLADRLACPRAAVRIVRGRNSRHKVVAVRGLSVDQAQQRLLR